MCKTCMPEQWDEHGMLVMVASTTKLRMALSTAMGALKARVVYMRKDEEDKGESGVFFVTFTLFSAIRRCSLICHSRSLLILPFAKDVSTHGERKRNHLALCLCRAMSGVDIWCFCCWCIKKETCREIDIILLVRGRHRSCGRDPAVVRG